MSASTKNASLIPGTELKSKERVYVIEEVLGAGSFGITYKATANVEIGNITTNVRFAIKEYFLSDSCYRGNDGKEVMCAPAARMKFVESKTDFITEANRLKKLCLKSRNIVSVNETFEANGTAYYVMEYLDGGSPRKCDEKTAVSIIAQIAIALDLIHRENVLHLDIKPDNIVLKTNKNNETYPVLIDFGISKHFDSNGQPTSSIDAKGASPGYAPQEQYAGVKEFSPKYDIYALGAVLFYLCTGENPPDAFKVSPNQVELKKKLDGKVSEYVQRAILNAMKPSAMERTPSTKQFYDDLMGMDFVPYLDVTPKNVHFTAVKNAYDIKVVSNIEWSVCCDCQWCKIHKAKDGIGINVGKNKDTSMRSCVIEVKGVLYDIKEHIAISQEGVGTIVFPDKKKRKPIAIKTSIALAAFLVFVISFYLWQSPTSAPSPYFVVPKDSTEVQQDTPIFAANQSISNDEQQANIITVPSENDEKIQVETDDLKFARAQNENNFDAMLNLAKKNYKKAYYPLANMYYNKGDKANAKFWAQKAVSANVNKKLAQSLIEKIAPSKKEKTNDELFTEAKTIEDFKALADKGYAKAYAPLARMYLNIYDDYNANIYAKKAGEAGVGIEVARTIVNILEKNGFYDDDKNGPKPTF